MIYKKPSNPIIPDNNSNRNYSEQIISRWELINKIDEILPDYSKEDIIFALAYILGENKNEFSPEDMRATRRTAILNKLIQAGNGAGILYNDFDKLAGELSDMHQNSQLGWAFRNL